MAALPTGTPVASSGSAVATLAVTMPSGITTGELLVVEISVSVAATISMADAGYWTQQAQDLDGFGQAQLAIFTRVADGTEGATRSFNFAAGSNVAALAYRITGQDTVSPINVVSATGTATSGSTTAVTCPSVTTSVDGCLILRFGQVVQATALADPAGHTAIGSATNGGGGSTDPWVQSCYQTQSTAGATGTAAFVETGGDRPWLAFTIAVAPAAVSGITIPAGSLALTGYAPSLNIQPTQVPAGAMTLQGAEPQLATPIIAVGWNDSNDSWSYVGGRGLVGGAQPSFVVGFVPAPGSLTFAGLAPTVVVSGSSGSTVAPGAGSLTLTGLAPTVAATANRTAAPAAGTLTLSGLVPTVISTANRVAAPGAGALALAGLAPTVAATDDRTAAPGAGALSLTGLAPTVISSASSIAAPGAGALTLTGLQPAVATTDNRSAVPAAGSLTLTGQVPTVLATANRTAAPAAATLSLTGLAPTVLATDHHVVTPGAGLLSLAGQAPAVQANGSMTAQPGAGHMDLTGLAPVVVATANRALTPGVGAITLTGLAPSVRIAIAAAPGAGALALSGLAPTVQVTDLRTARPGAGALALSGLAPQVLVSDHRVVSPGAGALGLTGYAPELPASSPVATPDAGTLALFGHEPTILISGDGLLSAKYLGRAHNTKVKWLRKKEEKPPKHGLPAAEPPAAEPAPPASPARGRGLKVPTPAVEEPPAVEVVLPTPRVVVPIRPAVPSAGAVPITTAPAAASSAPAASPAPASTAEMVQAMTLVFKEALSEQITLTSKALGALESQIAALRKVTEELVAKEAIRALEERNRRRADAIARKLLNDDEEGA